VLVVTEYAAPVQVIVYLVVPLMGPTVTLLSTAVLDVHPPLAAQDVAFEETQEITVVPPLATIFGAAVMYTVGKFVPTETFTVAGAD
jgi:hypothetical protein